MGGRPTGITPHVGNARTRHSARSIAKIQPCFGRATNGDAREDASSSMNVRARPRKVAHGNWCGPQSNAVAS